MSHPSSREYTREESSIIMFRKFCKGACIGVIFGAMSAASNLKYATHTLVIASNLMAFVYAARATHQEHRREPTNTSIVNFSSFTGISLGSMVGAITAASWLGKSASN